MNKFKSSAQCCIEKNQSPPNPNKNLGEITLNDIRDLLTSIISHEFTHKAIFILVCAGVLTVAVLHTGTRYTSPTDVYIYCAVYSAWITTCLPWLVQHMDGKALGLVASVIFRLFAADVGILIWSAFRGQRHLLQRGLRIRPMFEPSMSWLEDAGYNLRYGVIIASVIASAIPSMIDMCKNLRRKNKVDKEVSTVDTLQQKHGVRNLPAGDSTCTEGTQKSGLLNEKVPCSQVSGITRKAPSVENERKLHLSGQASAKQGQFIEDEGRILNKVGVEKPRQCSRILAELDELHVFPESNICTHQAGRVTFSDAARAGRNTGKDSKHVRRQDHQRESDCSTLLVSANGNNVSNFTGRSKAVRANSTPHRGVSKEASPENCCIEKVQTDFDDPDKISIEGAGHSPNGSKVKGRDEIKRACALADGERNMNHMVDEAFSDDSCSCEAEENLREPNFEGRPSRDRRGQRSRGAESLKNSVRDLMALKKLMMD